MGAPVGGLRRVWAKHCCTEDGAKSLPAPHNGLERPERFTSKMYLGQLQNPGTACVFEGLRLTSRNFVVQEGPWFTPGHFEYGLHDSIAFLLSGKSQIYIYFFSKGTCFVGSKLTLHATTARGAFALERTVTCGAEFLRLFSRAPRGLEKTFVWRLMTPGDLIVQPASTSAHAVLTFDTGELFCFKQAVRL